MTSRSHDRRQVLASARRIERRAGKLATAAVGRMSELAWFRELPAEHRSWVGLIAQAGVGAFVDWLRAPERVDVTKPVFGSAPRELARVITLQQAVELLRLTVDTVEGSVDDLAAPGEAQALTEALLRFSREVAFSAARVYASAAEERGAWHARQRALFIDAVLREEGAESLRGRATSLAWGTPAEVAVVAGGAPDGDPETLLDDAERLCRAAGLEALSGFHGDRLVVVVGAEGGVPARVARAVGAWGKGPVVVGTPVADVGLAPRSARSALAGLRAAGALPDAPRPVAADDLLPERALDGDPDARRRLVEDVHDVLEQAGGMLETVSAYLRRGCSIEAAARDLYLHPNTVRYRLRKAVELTGVPLTEPRGAYVAQVALTLGRLSRG